MDTTSTKFRHERLSVVHGGFNGAWVWDDVAEQLQDAGHRIRVVDQLPSAGTDPTSLADLGVDVSYVRQMLDTPDEPVVLVGLRMPGWSSPSSLTTRRWAQCLSRGGLATAQAVSAEPAR